MLSSAIRSVLLIGFLAILTACTQSSRDSSAVDKILSADQISAKKQASRKRLAEKREQRRAAFKKRREEQRAARAGASDKKEKQKTKLRPSPKKLASTSKKTKKKKSAKTRSRSVKRAKSIKGTKYALVRGRGHGITMKAPWKCLPNKLKLVLKQVSKKFGKVIVTSTHRSHRSNRLVGGKRRSYHLKCQAVDFRVKGKTRGLTRWLARHPYVGGYNRYPSGFYHIDTGPKRTW